MRAKEITHLVERFLLEKGYVCRREIRLKYRTADIVGYKPPKKFIAVEVKSDIDDPIRGIGQAIAYGTSVDESFLAVDEKRFEEIREIVPYLPLGILVASRKGLVLWKKS